jgi:hypothetical protein
LTEPTPVRHKPIKAPLGRPNRDFGSSPLDPRESAEATDDRTTIRRARGLPWGADALGDLDEDVAARPSLVL